MEDSTASNALLPLVQALAQASPRVAALIEAVMQRQEEIESYASGGIEATYSQTAIKLRVVPPGIRYPVKGED